MSFRWFIYYCTLWGGCAAYLGWVVGRFPPVNNQVMQSAVKGLLLGIILAAGLTTVDTLWNSSGKQGATVLWRLLFGAGVGGTGGFVGGMLGQILYSWTQLSLFLILGWTITGLLIGVSPGIYDWLAQMAHNESAHGPQRKVLNGLLGGGLGGLIGGILFLALRGAWSLALSDRTDEFGSPSATGFVALGMCIGLFIGLAQVILKEAWIRIEAGFRAGRELILVGAETTIGRAEGCQIALFGDMDVEKLHARILLQRGRYVLADEDTLSGTYLNGEEIVRPTPLRSGDLIEVGRSALRFRERQKRVEED